MSQNSRALDITIMGRTYKVACADEERESLLQAVAYLDGKMNDIKASGRVGNAERIAVMAALNITHELLSTKAAHGTEHDFDFEGVKRRMSGMQAMLDQALEPHDNLF